MYTLTLASVSGEDNNILYTILMSVVYILRDEMCALDTPICPSNLSALSLYNASKTFGAVIDADINAVQRFSGFTCTHFYTTNATIDTGHLTLPYW